MHTMYSLTYDVFMNDLKTSARFLVMTYKLEIQHSCPLQQTWRNNIQNAWEKPKRESVI
jgi:hypothetical protein